MSWDQPRVSFAVGGMSWHCWAKDAFPGSGFSRDQEVAALKRELSQVQQERDFFAGSGGVLRQTVEVK